MAAFTNLALSASHLGTKYLNKIFAIHRGQYDELGMLLITAALIGLTIPIAAVVLFNPATGLAWKTIKGRFRVSGVRSEKTRSGLTPYMKR